MWLAASPGLYPQPVIIEPNVSIPPFSLLGIERSLALLKPGVFENFKRGKDEWQRADPIVFGRAVPILNHRAHGSGVLPNLHAQVEKRRNHSQRRDQLRDGVKGFDVHTPTS